MSSDEVLLPSVSYYINNLEGAYKAILKDGYIAATFVEDEHQKVLMVCCKSFDVPSHPEGYWQMAEEGDLIVYHKALNTISLLSKKESGARIENFIKSYI